MNKEHWARLILSLISACALVSMAVSLSVLQDVWIDSDEEKADEVCRELGGAYSGIMGTRYWAVYFEDECLLSHSDTKELITEATARGRIAVRLREDPPK